MGNAGAKMGGASATEAQPEVVVPLSPRRAAAWQDITIEQALESEGLLEEYQAYVAAHP